MSSSSTSSRDAQLIKCLEDVEDRLSDFLKMKDASGITLLMQGVGKLGADPAGAIEILREAFKKVVDPVLLASFDGTWMAFLLWNDFTRRVQVLYNYSTSQNRQQYEFVSGFVNSKEFEREFTEPMTDVIFTEKTAEKHVMVFSWGCCPDEKSLAHIGDVPENIRPLLVSFDDLGGKWNQRLNDIRDFVDEAAASTDGQRNKDFAGLAQRISSLSRDMLEDENAKVAEIIQQARQQIYTKFELLDNEDNKLLIDVEALCRTLIWNRLFDPEWQYLYYIPAKFLSGSAVSGIVCAFRDLLPPRDYIVLTQIVNRIFSLFHFGSYGQQLNLFALRSATAAIMARNKSHIHGSHIEHGLRNKMEDFSSVISKRLIKEEPFYRSLRDKLGILDDSDPKEALDVRIKFIQELAIKLVEAQDLDNQITELDNHRLDINFLEDISEWLSRAYGESF